MSTIIDYQVISAYGYAALTIEIKNEIRKGWQPVGGVSCVTAMDPKSGKPTFICSQALVIYSAGS